MKKFLRKFEEQKRKKRFCNAAAVDSDTLTVFGNVSCRNTGSPEMVRIGDHCTLGCELLALYGGKIQIGNNTYIGPQTSIQAKESIIIGDNVIIANNVIIVDNNNHPVDSEMRLKMSLCSDFLHDELWSWKYAESKPIVIEDNVWIGRDSRILKGVHIGKGAVVALGAIVTKDVPQYSVVAGNPARVVKHLDMNEENI